MRVVHAVGLVGALFVGGCATAISGSADNITRLEKARTANPTSEQAARSLGIVYFKANRFDDARGVLQQAVAMAPNDGMAALYLGLTAEAQNDNSSARVAYESYMKVGQTPKVRALIGDRLQALRLKDIRAAAKQALARESQLSATPGAPNTVAVMPFSFTGADSSLKPLERGFAELVTTDLSRSSSLTVLDRMRLQSLLDEIALQQNGTQEGTGVRAGKMLQAGKMVGGTIQQQGERLQASAIVTDVASTQLAAPTTDNQTLDQLFTLEKNIALGLFNNLGITLTTAERNAIEQRPTRSLAAFLAYSHGLELEDQGKYDDARRSFDDAVRVDPRFGAAAQKSQEVKSVSAGNAVTANVVEGSLRGSVEGAMMNDATGASNTNGTVVETVEGLNPSTAGAATGGSGKASTQPAKDAASGTGGDNVTKQTAKFGVVIHQPGKP